jgi:hypothetical protein
MQEKRGRKQGENKAKTWRKYGEIQEIVCSGN